MRYFYTHSIVDNLISHMHILHGALHYLQGWMHFLQRGAALFAGMDAFLAEGYCIICRGALHILHGSAPLGDNFGDNLGITRYPHAIFAGGAALFAGMDAFLADGTALFALHTAYFAVY